MTEQWWRQYIDNKKKSENKIFTDVDSELKRRFKSEKKPEEMYSLCKTDNNYWKHYRYSENLDPDSVSLVLCKDIGCDLMYCQALTMQGKNDMYGCKEQFQNFRDCYVKEKRKFNYQHSEDEWLKNRSLIPEYIEKQLAIMKEEKMKENPLAEAKVIKVDESKVVNLPKKMVMDQKTDGYF